MKNKELDTLAKTTGRLALLAAAQLEQKLCPSEGEPDTRTAKELSAIVKDMVALTGQLRGSEPRSITVRFDEDTREGSL